jgi:serine protease AprX
MKNRWIFGLIVIAMCLSSCAPATVAPTSAPASNPTAGVHPALTNPPSDPIQAYQDVRNIDVSSIHDELTQALIETLWFNQSNQWPDKVQSIAQDILERGKNPGLGIRKLHAQGITGKGIKVAIIDQNLVVDHPEFQGKIAAYIDTGTRQPSNEGSMHGPAVTSLLVGENTGTAPDASVYFAAAPSWTGDAQFYADALNWIVDENNKLPEGGKIRVVSVSAAPSGPGTPFTKNNAAWDAAYQRASAAGILVLDCTQNHGITAPCILDLADPDNLAKCTPGFGGTSTSALPDRIYIPTSHRTSAEEYQQGNFSYQYTGQGGLSWSIPYLSGVLALGWQLRPDLSGAKLVEMIFASAYLTDGNLKIINPPAFIEMVKAAR